MKKQLKLVGLLVMVCIASAMYGQKFDMSGTGKNSKVYYKDGSNETGKLIFGATYLIVKQEDEKKKSIDIASVQKFEVYKKNDTTIYTFVLSERNFNKKKQQMYLCILKYDGENIKLFNEYRTAAKVGVFTIGTEVLFIQKKGAPYCEALVKPNVNMYERLKEYFADCPSLVEKIGTTYEYKKSNSIYPILDYYNTNCK